MKQVQVSLYDVDYFIIYFRFGFYWLFSYQLAKGDGNKTTILPYHLLYLQLYIYIYDDTRKSPTPDSSMMGRPNQ